MTGVCCCCCCCCCSGCSCGVGGTTGCCTSDDGCERRCPGLLEGRGDSVSAGELGVDGDSTTFTSTGSPNIILACCDRLLARDALPDQLSQSCASSDNVDIKLCFASSFNISPSSFHASHCSRPRRSSGGGHCIPEMHNGPSTA